MSSSSEEEAASGGKQADSSGLPTYPSSDEHRSSDEEPQPFPADPTFPERKYRFDETWSMADELEFRHYIEQDVIRLSQGLKGYDAAVTGEKLYWKDRTKRDRERRANPPPAPPELKISEHAFMPPYVNPNGMFFSCFVCLCFISFLLLLLFAKS